ncbi:MAG: hypothetical protein LBS52_04350 [Dysgonamonadaceae bacterium]|nr:hypothetical protein [Dysgonamonadaceae bacterium]
MKEVKKKITVWSPEKAKGTFNAQYVINLPHQRKESRVYGQIYPQNGIDHGKMG